MHLSCDIGSADQSQGPGVPVRQGRSPSRAGLRAGGTGPLPLSIPGRQRQASVPASTCSAPWRRLAPRGAGAEQAGSLLYLGTYSRGQPGPAVVAQGLIHRPDVAVNQVLHLVKGQAWRALLGRAAGSCPPVVLHAQQALLTHGHAGGRPPSPRSCGHQAAPQLLVVNHQ